MAHKVLTKPDFTIAAAEGFAAEHFDCIGTATELPGESDQNFRIESKNKTGSRTTVLKIANLQTSLDWLEVENAAINLVSTLHEFKSPQLQRTFGNSNIATIENQSGQFFYVRCLSLVEGVPLAEYTPHDRSLLQAIGRGLAEVDQTLMALNKSLATKRELQWDLRNAPEIVRRTSVAIEDDEKQNLLQHALTVFERFAEQRIPQLPCSVIHNDANDYNILVQSDPAKKRPAIQLGLVDFGDMLHAPTINELAICAAYALMNKSDPVDDLVALTRGYCELRELSELEFSVLFPLTQMRLAQSVCLAIEQRKLQPDNEYLSISEEPAWQLLKTLSSLDPEKIQVALSETIGLERLNSTWNRLPNQLAADQILQLRQQHLSPSLSLAYDQPLTIVRGRDQYLYDQSNATYLDCVNNVCHVGHCHPGVAQAARAQIETLNTNTRYLHENVVRYAARLTATLPTPLNVCFFVNSGSEANDLAMRLAMAQTGHRDFVVIDHAYHGHTAALIELSPYKFNGAGGLGKPDHVHVLDCPDVYRGKYRVDTSELDHHQSLQRCSSQYADAAKIQIETVIASGRKIAGFFAEAILGCGGQIPLPHGYLKQIVRSIQANRGVYIADEVQIGFGRVGTHFWGFEQHDVIPDIVTMGKPMGNGHPLAAVITTREIADAFNNGMEYFNTFGGNPVSAAVGMAVLDAIENDGLQKHAFEVGNYLLGKLHELQGNFQCIGDVRGSGLFLGIELVRDRRARTPDSELARRLVERMKARRILLSTDGPSNNVVKFKPPMVFNQADADRLVFTLNEEVRKLVD